jgi:hypothetical protein
MMTREEYYAAVAEYKEAHLEHREIKDQKGSASHHKNFDEWLTNKGIKEKKLSDFSKK